MAIFDVAAAFDDDVGMGLEQADDLVAGRDRFASKEPDARSAQMIRSISGR